MSPISVAHAYSVLLVAGRVYVRGADLLPSSDGGQDGFAAQVATSAVVDPAGVGA